MDETLKQRLFPAIIAFNLTVIVFVLATQLKLVNLGLSTFVNLFLAVVLGAVVGGIAFAVTAVMQK